MTGSTWRGRRLFAVVASAVVLAGIASAGAAGAAGARSAGPQPPPRTWSPQAATYGQGSELNLPIVAADGTVLRADVYYPTVPGTHTPAHGPFPVLLQQTPYGKEAIAEGGALSGTDLGYLVDRGYIVVISDVRGTGDSEGTWGLFDPIQGSDGATVARWAAKLPHADGKVGLFGESYMGINQFLTVGAAGRNSPIKAMFPIIAGDDIYSDTVTQGGIPDIEFGAFYLALMAGLNAASPLIETLEAPGSAGAIKDLLAIEADHTKGLDTTDLALIKDLETGGPTSYDGPYWAGRSPESYLADVVADHVPAFLVGGWNDLFQQGELLNYTGLQNIYDGRPQSAPMAPGQRVTPRYQLMMGPWMHVTTGAGVNVAALEVEWFDTWLLGEKTPLVTTTTPLHLEQLQSGKWYDASTWPVQGETATAFYFGPGRTHTDHLSFNDGTLSTTPPDSSFDADTVLWSPVSSPCDIQTDQWSAGFARLALSYLHGTDPCDNDDRTLGDGPDALTFTSAPFGSAEVISGPIDATVYARSNTTNTELAATVEEVSPTGKSEPLTSGALLGSLRQVDRSQSWVGSDGKYLLPYHPLTAASARAVVPGAITEYDIAVFPTNALIPAGWRLRVTLTTADTPHLVPSLVDTLHLVGGIYQVQTNTSAPSYINVPLMPAAALDQPCGSICSLAGP